MAKYKNIQSMCCTHQQWFYSQDIPYRTVKGATQGNSLSLRLFQEALVESYGTVSHVPILEHSFQIFSAFAIPLGIAILHFICHVIDKNND